MGLTDYAEQVAIGLSFRPSAPHHPKEAKDGDIYFNTSQDQMYCYHRGNWNIFSSNVQSTSHRLRTSPLLKDGRCSCCGAPDSTKLKCNYCQTVLRWYE